MQTGNPQQCLLAEVMLQSMERQRNEALNREFTRTQLLQCYSSSSWRPRSLDRLAEMFRASGPQRGR